MARVARAEARVRGVGAGLKGFAPILDPHVKTLILGSFPSEASLAAGQYYAHPRNQFWTILGALLGEPLRELPYPQRKARVLAHRVGIWDVLDACERAGSLDSSIRRAQPNDFARLRRRAPALRRVLFNGLAAGRFAPAFAAAGYDTQVLPSTSPAHAGRSLDQKLAAWRAAFAAPLRPAHRVGAHLSPARQSSTMPTSRRAVDVARTRRGRGAA